MSKLLVKFVLLVVTVFALATKAAPIFMAEQSRCLNEANENNLALKNSFTQCWDPLGRDYLSNVASNNSLDFNDSSVCSRENLDSQKINMRQLSRGLAAGEIDFSSKRASEDNYVLGFSPAQLPANTPRSEMIKKECIVASMKRNPGNKGYICEYPGDPAPKGVNPAKQSILKYYGQAGGATAQCVDDQMTDYVHFAVNSAIQCLSGINKVDSKTIFRKINNESAFNISVASGGGVGIGQLTPIAVKEMIDPSVGKGRYILEHISKSNDQSCNGFKELAASDLKRAPSIAESNRCAWISPGDGLARNLVYSIGYYLTMRDKYIVPALLKRAPSLAKNEGLLNDLVSIAYGAEGISHAKSLLNKFRVNGKTNITELRKKIRKNSRYLANIKSKIKEVNCIQRGWHSKSKNCQQYQMSSEELEGESCTSSL